MQRLEIAAPEALASDDYVLPMTNANLELGLPEGKSVVFDTHNSPDGQRYIIENRVQSDDETETRRFSGITTAPVRRMSATERLERAARKRQRPSQASPPRLSPELTDTLNVAASSTVRVIVRLDVPDEIPMFRKLQRLAADGRLATKTDLAYYRSQLVEGRQAHFIDDPGALFVNLLVMGDRQGSRWPKNHRARPPVGRRSAAGAQVRRRRHGLAVGPRGRRFLPR